MYMENDQQSDVDFALQKHRVNWLRHLLESFRVNWLCGESGLEINVGFCVKTCKNQWTLENSDTQMFGKIIDDHGNSMDFAFSRFEWEKWWNMNTLQKKGSFLILDEKTDSKPTMNAALVDFVSASCARFVWAAVGWRRFPFWRGADGGFFDGRSQRGWEWSWV